MKYIIIIFVAVIITTIKAQSNQSCTTPDRTPGSCIELSKCTYLFNILQRQAQSRNEDEVTFLRQSRCNINSKTVFVCCAIQTRQDVRLPNARQCGTGGANRIYGGNETDIGEFPWMALIEYTKGGGVKGHNCGGSLINNRYVITAAHCVKQIPGTWKLTGVRLGEWDRNTERDCKRDIRGYEECADPPIDINVEKVIVHENYNGNIKAQYNDIALLRLGKQIDYTEWISPICLPTSNTLRNSKFDGQVLDVAGWGQTEHMSTSNIKLKAEVDANTLESCNNIYSKQNIVLRDGQMCAGGAKGIDSCRGDSGGPLIAIDNTNKARINYVLAGIVSFGPTPCGLKGWPGVYTRVGEYIDWIQSKLEP